MKFLLELAEKLCTLFQKHFSRHVIYHDFFRTWLKDNVLRLQSTNDSKYRGDMVRLCISICMIIPHSEAQALWEQLVLQCIASKDAQSLKIVFSQVKAIRFPVKALPELDTFVQQLFTEFSDVDSREIMISVLDFQGAFLVKLTKNKARCYFQRLWLKN